MIGNARALLASLRSLLEQAEEHVRALEELSRPAPARPKDPAPPPKPGQVIEPIHQALLKAAPPFDAPVKTGVLIKAAKYGFNSWSREKVTELCQWGLLYRHPRNRGVSLPHNPAEDEQGGRP